MFSKPNQRRRSSITFSRRESILAFQSVGEADNEMLEKNLNDLWENGLDIFDQQSCNCCDEPPRNVEPAMNCAQSMLSYEDQLLQDQIIEEELDNVPKHARRLSLTSITFNQEIPV